MFKIGDKVRCVSPRNELVMGGVYTVTRIKSDVIHVNNTNTDYFNYRFELVTNAKPINNYYDWLASDRSKPLNSMGEAFSN